MARPDMFRLADLEGKGAGLVAVEDISPGTLLISEPPVLRVTIMDGDLSPGASKDVSRQFSGMEEDQRKVVMRLANSYDDNNEILGIFRTNAMIISSSEAAVFPWVCRANHSCVPNCNYHHDSQTGLQHLYSATRILKGEELTVSYLPDNMLGCRAARQSHLMKSHRYPVTHLPIIITCTRHDYMYPSFSHVPVIITISHVPVLSCADAVMYSGSFVSAISAACRGITWRLTRREGRSTSGGSVSTFTTY